MSRRSAPGPLATLALATAVTTIHLTPTEATLRLSDAGRARAAIVVAADATEAEQTAAGELADFLKQVTGAEFETGSSAVPGRAIIAVGPTASQELEPTLDLSLTSLGLEGIVIHAD